MSSINPYIARTLLTCQKTIIDLLGNLILLIGIATIALAAKLMWWSHSVVPFWDEWSLVLAYNYFHLSPLRWIWHQHNEHRIVLAKLLFILDMSLVHGRNWPMFTGIYLCPVIFSALIGYMLRQFGARGSVWSSCFGIALYCSFCPSQWENFYWAFQISFLAVNIWALLAILNVLIYKQRLEADHTQSMNAVVVSLLAAMFATFTNGNGIVVWPVLVVLAVVARLPRRLIAIYIGGFACGITLYLAGYQSPPHADPLASIRQPLLLLEYIEKYLGGAVVWGTQYDWAIQVGQAILILSFLLLARLFRRRLDATLLDYAFGGILLYSLATAFITSLGRITFGTDQAFTPRYQTFALLLWFAITSWIIVILSRRGANNSLVAVYIGVAAITCLSLRGYRPILETVKDRIMQREIAGTAIVTGVRDDSYLKTAAYPEPMVVWESVEYLKPHALSVFSTSVANEMGWEFSRNYKLWPAGACAGNVDAVTQVTANSNDSRLEGWAIDQRTKKPLRTVLFVAEDKVVGYGISGTKRFDVVRSLGTDRAFRSGWVGYAKIPTSDEQLDVYGVMTSSGDAVCLLKKVTVR